MSDRYTNDPTRTASARTTHDPTAAQGAIVEGAVSFSGVGSVSFSGLLLVHGAVAFTGAGDISFGEAEVIHYGSGAWWSSRRTVASTGPAIPPIPEDMTPGERFEQLAQLAEARQTKAEKAQDRHENLIDARESLRLQRRRRSADTLRRRGKTGRFE